MPRTFNIISMTKDNLFAGKMHALLCRSWKNRVKGRDWYDFEWYVKNGFELNLEHLTIRARESGSISSDQIFTKELLVEMLQEKIKMLDINSAKLDIRRFVADDKVLDIWSQDYFLQLVDKIH